MLYIVERDSMKPGGRGMRGRIFEKEEDARSWFARLKDMADSWYVVLWSQESPSHQAVKLESWIRS